MKTEKKRIEYLEQLARNETAKAENAAPANELTRDAQIREIARDVLNVELEERYNAVAVHVWNVRLALNAAFAAGADWQRKQVQNAD